MRSETATNYCYIFNIKTKNRSLKIGGDPFMLGKKKAEIKPIVEEKKEKPIPGYLREDYPYKTIGEPITDFDSLVQHGVLYEIKCPKCEMSIRSQGCNVKSTYEQLINGKGCVGCGNKELIVKLVDMSGIFETK